VNYCYWREAHINVPSDVRVAVRQRLQSKLDRLAAPHDLNRRARPVSSMASRRPAPAEPHTMTGSPAHTAGALKFPNAGELLGHRSLNEPTGQPGWRHTYITQRLKNGLLDANLRITDQISPVVVHDRAVWYNSSYLR